jgi:MFS family permease
MRSARRTARVSLAVTFVTLALTYGVWYAYSVFLVALLHEFGWSRSVLAGAFSVFTLVNGAWNPVVGWLTDRLGAQRVVMAGGALLGIALVADSFIAAPWHLYALFGVVTAIAVSTAGWTPAVVMVQRDFRARLGLALGIAGSGIGVGIFLIVPFCQLLIDAYGWRSAFRVLGVLAAAWIIPATWLAIREPAPGAAGELPMPPGELPEAPPAPAADPPASGARDLTLGAALLTGPFWLIAGAKFLGNICSQMLLVHQAAYLVDQGITPIVAASVISVVGASSIVGKTGGGWLSDLVEREVVYVLGKIAMVLSIVMLGLVAIAPSPWSAYGYAILLGLGYSVTASLIPAMVSDRFRGPHFGAIFGASQVGSAIGSALGAWVAGRIFDATGSYRLAFVGAAGAAIAGAIAVWIARELRVRAAASAGTPADAPARV